MGLSPRVWGNLIGLKIVLAILGSIPTCVGKPRLAQGRERVGGVYPHVCGETQTKIASGSSHPGLSPRVWGNPDADQLPWAGYRSIPTCVGQPSEYAEIAYLGRVYPHVCGATGGKIRKKAGEKGLSPRVWGNPQFSQISELT